MHGHAPRRIEDTYSVTDAVVTGSLLLSLLRHADRVGIACQAQLVNVLAPIRAEPGDPAWRQASFYPFAGAARHARGTILRTASECPIITTARYGDVPAADAVVSHDEGTGAIVLLAVNREQHEALRLRTVLRGFPGQYRVVEHRVLSDPDPDAANDASDPDRVRPRQLTGARVSAGVVHAKLPALSWNVLRLLPVSP